MRPCDLVILAAGLDWLEGLLPIAFVLIWIVSQVMNMFRNAAGKRVDQAAGKPLKQFRPAPGPERRLDGERPLAVDEEIEEFLRRTLRGDRPQPVRSAKQQPPPRPRPPKPVAANPVRQLAVSSRSISPPLSVPRRANRHPESIGGLAEHGGDVARHVAAAFAHDLAHEVPLVAVESSAVETAPLADELLAALRSPAGLRQLILMREVLDRPTHRW